MKPNKPKRLILEEEEMTKNPPEGVSILPDQTNLLKWEILIAGPKYTPYEGGIFVLSCKFPENYPFKAPDIYFKTKIYHPYVCKNSGWFNNDYLIQDWVPIKKMRGLIGILMETFFLRPPNNTVTFYSKIRFWKNTIRTCLNSTKLPQNGLKCTQIKVLKGENFN